MGHLFGVAAARAGALRALEPLGLFFEKWLPRKNVRVINVAAICADPLSLPVAFFFCQCYTVNLLSSLRGFKIDVVTARSP